MAVLRPHYVREYRRLFRNMQRRHQGDDTLMSTMVGGGSYEAMGAREKAFLLSIGLKPTDYLIDVGCGSGRLSSALRDVSSLRYLGTDVVPDLIEYAIAKSARPDWKFQVVESLTIPERERQADMIVFFSVFTHLGEQECFEYLRDADRVVKPGGQIVVSFLDRSLPSHRNAAGNPFYGFALRLIGFAVKNTLLDRDDLAGWGKKLGLECSFHPPDAVGQSICVYRKPAAST